MLESKKNKSIIFILGSLEPGCDGVGDYTRVLAAACVQKGVNCHLISISDKGFNVGLKEEESDGFKIYRSNILNQDKGFLVMQSLLDKISVDWVSLQFVPYSYHPKGLVKRLISFFDQLSLKSNVHFMFHELWIGVGSDSGWKQYFFGKYQKFYIKKLIRTINPKLIHTSNEVYQNLLEKEGFKVNILPILSTISVLTNGDENSFFNLLSDGILKIDKGNRDNYWLVGNFGSIHKEWTPDPFIQMLAFSAQMKGKKLIFISFGNQGSGKCIWADLKKIENDSFECISLGALPEEKISLILSHLDYAISTSVYDLAYKSSVVMAYLEHGIPVLFSRFTLKNSLNLVRHPNHDLLLKATVETLSCLGSIKHKSPQSWLPDICNKFIKSID